MQEPSTIHSTCVIERSFPKSPERVFAFLADPAKKRLWFGESRGHAVEKFEMDFAVGGTERFAYRMNDATPFPGVELINEGYYLDIVPNQRVVTASSMTLGGRRISASLVTIELLPNGEGSTFLCTHQGTFFEGAVGPQMREAGWRTLFDKLGTELAR